MPSKYYYAVPWRERFLFLKLITKWKGSIWQLLWVDLLVYLLLSGSLSLFYRLILSRDEYTAWREIFEGYVDYLGYVHNTIPLSFLLGFFVSLTVARWWAVCMYIPWMSRSSILIASYLSNRLPNDEEETRQIRTIILRYMNLSIAIILRSVSPQLQSRFAVKINKNSQKGPNPMRKKVLRSVSRFATFQWNRKQKFTTRESLEVLNKDSKVKETFGCLITLEEIKTFERIAEDFGSKYEPEYWIPLQWALRVVQKARDNGHIWHNRHYIFMNQLIEDMREVMHRLWLYSTFDIPLVYIQVVMVAVYTFVLGDLFVHQFELQKPVNSTELTAEEILKIETMHLHVPFFAIFKFIFYVGWFKLGCGLLNPLGEENDDFPVSDIFSYNLSISMTSGSDVDFIYPSYLSNPKLSTDELIRELPDVYRRPQVNSQKADNNTLEEEELTTELL